MRYKLEYLGKKKNFIFDGGVVRDPIDFSNGPVWVNELDAETLMQINPLMFRKVQTERDPEEDLIELPDLTEEELAAPAPEAVPEEAEVPFDAPVKMEWVKGDDGKYHCNLCDHKPYTDRVFFAKHMLRKHNVVIPDVVVLVDE